MRRPFKPVVRPAPPVRYRQDDNHFRADFVDDLVRKTTEQEAPKLTVFHARDGQTRITMGMVFDAQVCRFKFLQKILAETRPLFLVPLVSFMTFSRAIGCGSPHVLRANRTLSIFLHPTVSRVR